MPLSQFRPENYQALLAQKTADVCALLHAHDLPAPQIFPSEPDHYRMRAEFRIWKQGDDVNYVMFKKEAPKTPVPIVEFPIGSRSMCSLMPQLLEHIKHSELLRDRLFQVEFLTTLSDEALITLIYHKPLDCHWQDAATTLAQTLGAHIIGRSRKQKLVLSQDFVTEQLRINNRSFRYVQPEGSFTQPNARINQQMIEWAISQSKNNAGDLLELYCGNGNFTIPLANYFQNVLATEVSKTATRAALENCRLNNCNNIQFVRLSAEEVASALNKERSFRRLKDIDIDAYHFTTVLVDPPRAGLDPASLALVQRFANIIYISCNPSTLNDNLTELRKTHRARSFALFDQFPYTQHMECGVYLNRLNP